MSIFTRRDSGITRTVSCIAIALLLAGIISCSGDGSRSRPQAAEPLSDQEAAMQYAAILVEDYSQAHTSAVIEALARTGISTYANDGVTPLGTASEPASGLRIYHSQAQGMAMELAGGSGWISGEEINRIIDPILLPDGSPLPVSALIAAYVTDGPSFGSELSRQLMGSVSVTDHQKTIFPTITVLLFVKDVLVPMLADAEVAGVGDASVLQSGAKLASTDPCGEVATFLDDLPGAVASAVQNTLAPNNTGSFWDGAVAVASSAVGYLAYGTAEAARAVISSVGTVSGVSTAADVLGGLADLHSMFSNWTVSVLPNPPAGLHKQPGSPYEGHFVLLITNPDSAEWPQAAESCASLFGIDLPQIADPNGSNVTWEPVVGFPGLAVAGAEENTVSNYMAKFYFTTDNEDPQFHQAGGAVRTETAKVLARVELPGMEDLARRIGSLMTASPQLGNVLGSAGGATGLAASALGPSKEGSIPIEYHETQAASIYHSESSVQIEAANCSGLHGLWSGTITITDFFPRSGSISFSFSESEASSPVTGIAVFSDAQTTTTSDFSALTANLEGLPDAPAVVFSGTLTTDVVVHTPAGDIPQQFVEQIPGTLVPITFEPSACPAD